MPQFKPLHWINLISWIIVLLSIGTLVHQSLLFPLVLRAQLVRVKLLVADIV
jgi:hypothetical protein